MIELDETAHNHILELMIDAGFTPDTHHLKVGVKGGGCSGLSYVMDFSDEPITNTEDQYEFDGNLKIVVDKKSLLYLYGSKLSYSDGLNGKGFQWVNPNASRTCGCGESFAV
jgi:iron-sulfur cluster assembly protein